MPSEGAPTVDFTNTGPVERFRFWIAHERPPAAPESIRTDGGALINALPPGYWECAMVSEAVAGMWGIFYWLQAGPGQYVILSSFDHYFDDAEVLMTNDGYRESRTALESGWPLFTKLRGAGLRGDMAEGCLVRARTSNDVQWGLCLHTGGFELTRIEQFVEGKSGEAFGRLQHLTLDLMTETYKGALEVPGVSEVVGAEIMRSGREWRQRSKRTVQSINDVLEVIDTFGSLVGG